MPKPWQQSEFYQKYVTPMDRTNTRWAQYLTQFDNDKTLMKNDGITRFMTDCLALYAFFSDYHQTHCSTHDNRRLCSDCLSLFAVTGEDLMNQALDRCFVRWLKKEETIKWPDESDDCLEEYCSDKHLLASTRENKDNKAEDMETNSDTASQASTQPSSLSSRHQSLPPTESHFSKPPLLKEQSVSPATSFRANPPSLILTHIVDSHLLGVERSYFEKTWNSWIEFVFADQEMPEKFLFENVDTIMPVGNDNVTISFKERPKKRFLDFFARRLKGNRSCRVKVYSHLYQARKQEENLFSSFKHQSQSPRTPRKQPKASHYRRFPSPKYSTQQPIGFTTSQFSQSPLGHYSTHNSNFSPSSYPSFNNNQPRLTSQSQYVSQEQLAQIQKQLDFLTLHLVRSQSWNTRRTFPS